MTTSLRGRTGVLVLSVWTEEPPHGSVRARIMRADDVAEPDEEVTVAGSVEEVCDSVRAWLEEFASD